ncbi:MAG: hypothetical protein ABIG30_03155 [Candidatus Aenigmatarchaeota archaeon]
MRDIVNDIRTMKIQSGHTIALESLKYLKQFAEKHGFGSAFNGRVRSILDARPTEVMLQNVLKELSKKKTSNKINELMSRINSMQPKINKNVSKILRGIIMVHCHSTELNNAIIASKRKVKLVYVTETRPRMQGLITAKEFIKSRVKIKFIPDSDMGYFMDKVDVVCVGADAITPKGVINKIGTLPMAAVARDFKKPFYVVANTMKFTRKKVVMESRSAKEVTTKLPKKYVLNPAFDITPWRYVTAVVTEKGARRRFR